jgi:non-heme chloroperoxidase
MLFFLHRGYRVIAHDRRGHGRSAQVSEGNDMNHYADDLADLTDHLDLHDAVHVGHSAGGGEVARFIGRHGESRVAKVVLISAVTPSVLQTDANPVGVPQAAFEGLQAQLAANRSEFYRAVPSGPFYNFDQPGVEPSEAVIANWWRQGMMGSAKGQYDCVSEFIREDYSDDLRKISVPVLVMNGMASSSRFACSCARGQSSPSSGTRCTSDCRRPFPKTSESSGQSQHRLGMTACSQPSQ